METLIFSIKFFLKIAGIVAVSATGMDNQSVKDNTESQKSIPTEIVYHKQDTVFSDTLNAPLNASVRCIEIDEGQLKKMG